MAFFSREQELAWLAERAARRAAQLLVVYGRRRVGKTQLLRRFLRGRDGAYFLADRRPEHEQLREVAARIGGAVGDEFAASKGFADWLEAFRYLAAQLSRRRRRRPFVLVIDEYPYLADNNAATSSLFQKGWDEMLSRLPLCLVLCGSSMAMMESETLNHGSPLYGRRTGDLLVRPLTLDGARQFLPKPRRTLDRSLELYALLGGMPGYLSRFDAAADVETNLVRHVLTPGSFLFREVDFLLREELREPRHYLAVLRAIGQGKRKFGDIANETGLDKHSLTRYLRVLERLQLTERDVPVTEPRPERSKRSLYRIVDPFVELWFQLVYPFVSDLELGVTEPSLDRYRTIRPQLLGYAYERLARERIRRASLPFRPERIGRWWDGSAEVDVVALSKAANSVLFAEAKWSRRAVGVDIYRDLVARAQRVAWGRDGRRELFALFSRSGFTAEMRRLGRREGVLLFTGLAT